MNPTTNQFLVEYHLQMLRREAEASRLAALARQTSKAQSEGRTDRSGLRFEVVRRLVARLAAA